MAASCAYGRPSCVRPARARLTGRAEASTCGKKPSRMVWVSSARVRSVRIEPPISFEPRLGTTSGTVSVVGSVSSVSLAARQA
ncbi:hypothetical protein D9M68_872950 [compost metagenome]